MKFLMIVGLMIMSLNTFACPDPASTTGDSDTSGCRDKTECGEGSQLPADTTTTGQKDT